MFQQFNFKIQEQFARMQEYKLFRLNVTGSQIWDAYLNGFLPEENPVFRDPESSTHNCNNDKNFIRRYGNIVAIDKNFNIISMFDIDVKGSIYEHTIQNIRAFIQSAKVSEVFFETFNELNGLPYEKISKNQVAYQLGMQKTLKKYTQEEVNKFGVVNAEDIYEFHHFHVFLQSAFVDKTGKSVESIMGEYRDAKSVFQRAMKEIPLDTLWLVRDLIAQGSLLNGDAHLFKLEQMISLKQEYDSLPANQRDNWCWVKSYGLPIAKFRNELIGTLCVELSEGAELNQACLEWNKRVDPANYMKAKAPITQKQIKEAEKFIEENGYVESFDRRFAILEDINVSEIRHMNVDGKEVKPAGLFAGVQPSVSTRHKRSQFDGIDEVTIEKFMNDILPSCTSVEAFVENRFTGNFVSLITANKPDSKPIFKWSNNYSWTYNGNLAGKSQIKEAVKTAGGEVEGVLRCSLIWNESGTDQSDLDLWCEQPDKQRIGFNTGFRKDQGGQFTSLGGQLDLDNRNPGKKVGIENIYFQNLQKLKNGKYHFWVNQFSDRNSQGFKAEIEFNGEVFQYEYNRKVVNNVKIATVILKDGEFTIEHHLPESYSNKTVWGLESNQFHKVNLVCLSPNFWGENNIGNKHYFFMLDGCHSDVPLRSFHNEFLIGDLLNHRKVTEVLADTTKLTPTKKQLAGLGFNATVSDFIILKLKGSFQRTIKVKF